MAKKRRKTVEIPKPVRISECLGWSNTTLGFAIALLKCMPQDTPIVVPRQLLRLAMVGIGGCNYEPGGCEDLTEPRAPQMRIRTVVKVLKDTRSYLAEVKKTVY